MNNKTWLTGIGAATLGLALWLGGCVDPLQREAEKELREQLIASNRSYLQSVAAGPVIELSRPPSDVETELTGKRRTQLDNLSGPTAYEQDPLDVGVDLLGQRMPKVVKMTLQQAIHHAAASNLDVRFARIQPAITETLVTQAEADFDAIFFSNFDFQKQDTPQPRAGAGLAAFGTVQQDTRSLTTGIRKNLVSGGDMTFSTQLGRNFRDPSFFSEPTLEPINVWYDSNILVSLNQPLLRNFGADINRAQILLQENARAEAIQDLHGQLLDTVLETEIAYWNLVFSRYELMIQQRLLGRTIAERNRLKQRKTFDVSPVQLTQANSFVELRRGNVIRARQNIRNASDEVKRLIYSKELPLAGEALILPLDSPADLPIKFSLLDAVSTALRHRPELRRKLYEINDATIRHRFAENQRLPQLDLAAGIQYNGVTPRKNDDLDDAFDTLTDGDFIDYIFSLQFELPIGNRQAEALYRQQQLARKQVVIDYRRTAEQVILEVKAALRSLHTNYQLIDAERASRRAAADNLRALEEQEEAGVALTPEFLLDQKLEAQRRLAIAETSEIQALIAYNAAISTLYDAMGTLLERNGIDFQDNWSHRVEPR